MEYQIREQGAITEYGKDERVGNYGIYESKMLVENLRTSSQASHENLVKAVILAFPDAEAIYGMEGELVWGKE